ncbi:MAG: GYD domain-containing protein [Dehalococcoidia bacterium]|nr:GYD domain-containing protein [Dehalococcoidia bacterium]
MPKYLFQASYTQEGLRGLMDDGATGRKEMAEDLVASLGGSIEAFYYAFGDSDLYVIADLPDDASAAAASVAVGASGTASIKTTVLVTPETIDEAVKKSMGYPPPGS